MISGFKEKSFIMKYLKTVGVCKTLENAQEHLAYYKYKYKNT